MRIESRDSTDLRYDTGTEGGEDRGRNRGVRGFGAQCEASFRAQGGNEFSRSVFANRDGGARSRASCDGLWASPRWLSGGQGGHSEGGRENAAGYLGQLPAAGGC
jgi:hypothetical protein